MAYKVSIATGNWSTAATWGDSSSASLADVDPSTTLNTALSTSNQDSSAFTPAAANIVGVCLKLYSRAVSPTGTMTVTLIKSSDSSTLATVTINVSDLDTNANGWAFFKFGTPWTADGVIACKIRCLTSSNTQVNLCYSSTSTNWARILVTDTTGVPAAGDSIVVAGAYTGQGASSTYTVTMDNTANTDYGPANASLTGLSIGAKGTLNFGSSSSTNYLLRLSGYLDIWAGGTLSMGTVATPIPRDSTAQLEFDCQNDGDFGLRVRNGGTLIGQGLSRSSGKNIVACKLNTDEAVASTSLGVDTDTGWLSGDMIGVASTTRTYSQTEYGTLNGAAGASTLTVNGFGGAGGGLANAHSGTAPTQAEVILLTRNVKIKSVSTTAISFLYFDTSSIVDLDWVEISYIGTNTSLKRSIEVATGSTGSCTLSYCAIHDAETYGMFITSTTGSVTIEYCTIGKTGTVTPVAAMQIAATSGAHTINNCYIFATGSSLCAILSNDANSHYTNNVLVGGASASYGPFYLRETIIAHTGTFYNNIFHSSAGHGLRIFDINASVFKIDSCSAWRCTGYGLYFSYGGKITILNSSFFGNTTANIFIDGFANIVNIYDTNIASNSGPGYTTTYGIQLGSGAFISKLLLDNCTIGVATGVYTAHATADIATTNAMTDITSINCVLGSAQEITELGTASELYAFRKQRQDQTNGLHCVLYGNGTVALTTAANTYKTASPGEKLVPSAATVNWKLKSGSKRVAVASGGTATISVWVRKASSPAYNGANEPRLMLKRNTAAGITSDTVIETFSGATDTWVELNGTTSAVSDDAVLEFYVDCEGTAGEIYIDDWSVS